MVTNLWKFREKCLQYEQQARSATDDLLRASYVGLTEAYRELTKILEQETKRSARREVGQAPGHRTPGSALPQRQLALAHKRS